MDVGAWLRGLGLGQYEQAFRDNDIEARVLPGLTTEDLKEIGVASVGHRRLLLQAAAALSAPTTAPGLTPVAPEIATPEPPQAERRQLTVMFADLVGSTALSVRLDPEDMRDAIRAYQDSVAGVVARFEGIVAKFLGDGVLAYFGFPQAHEDDAERAVRAGLAIVEAIGRLRSPDGAPLVARLGIATGLVVVGDLIGSGPAQEHAVVGETPNLAARLQALAEPGTVIIAPTTRRLVGGLFEYADLGDHHVKGFVKPVRVWRVLGPGRAEGRFEALHGGSLAPVVGREQELALLLDRWKRAKEGEGQVVLVCGEPGIGKSRLMQALGEHLRDEPYAHLRYFCSPYFTDTMLHPMIGQLERAAGLERDDPPARKLDKLEALLAEATDDPAAVVPLLAALLSVPAGGRYPPLTLSPQRLKESTQTALVSQLEGVAARRPVLFAWEDAHWSDPTSLELLDRLIDRVQSFRVLVVITFRPEFAPPWTRHGHVTALTLARLSRRQATTAVDQLTGGKALPTPVLDQILTKTDGVPLFVEELTKAVLESGLLEKQGDRYVMSGPLPPLAIPATLQDSLTARLDRLAHVKEVAQIGAAIGREFSYELLAAVAPMGENELREALARLCDSGLVFCRGTPPEAAYMFKHALVQDAAGASLLRGRRRQLHARIASTLEERFPETPAAAPELLAHHWTEAGSTSKAVELWIEAGERALTRAANREASGFFERALAALNGLDETPELLARIVDLRRSLYNATYKFGELPRTRANLVEAERLAARLNDSTRLCRILVDMTYILGCTGDITGAIASGERAVASATRGEDLEARVQSRVQLARSLYAKGWYREAIGHIRDVIAMLGGDVRRGRLGPGLNQTISARVWLVLFHAELGEFPACAALAEEARRLAEYAEGAWGPEGQVWLRLALGRTAVLRGEFAEAVETLEPALTPCESEFAIYFSRVASSLGMAHTRLGHLERGVALLHEAVARDQAIGFGFRFGLQLAQLGEALLLAGDADGALDAGTRALETARNAGEEASQAWALNLFGEIAAGRDQPRAAAYYREALDIAERLAMAPLTRRCLEGLAGLGL